MWIKFYSPNALHNFVAMKIEHYISRLLYRYDCVTVPGFGAFLTEFQSARLLEGSHGFYPPKKRLSFNAQLRHNDGLLANHIALSENTTYEVAVTAIANEVSIWKNILDVNGKFTLKNIGELSLNADGNVEFTASDNLNYLPESFGLGAFVSPAVKREEYKQQVVYLEEKAPLAFTPEKRKRKPWLRYAAAVTLFAGLGLGVTYKLHSDHIERETFVVESQVQEQVQHKIQEATFFMESPLPAVTLTIKEEKLNYHIVAGVFRSEENAKNACKQLKELGYKARQLDQNRHGLFPVLYGSYADAATAKTSLKEIRHTRDVHAWLLVKEL